LNFFCPTLILASKKVPEECNANGYQDKREELVKDIDELVGKNPVPPVNVEHDPQCRGYHKDKTKNSRVVKDFLFTHAALSAAYWCHVEAKAE
jgi:hypothetical protein